MRKIHWCAIALLLAGAVADSAQVTITEYPIATTPGSNPRGITSGPDGNLWFTEQLGNKIGRITTAGVITEFPIGTTPGSEPIEITSGPDGNLWFTESSGNKIGRITVSGVITEFPITTTPRGITSGPDGNLWFTEQFANKIGRITTAGVITEFAISGFPPHQPLGITSGQDSNLWFTEVEGNRIGRITTAGVITEFPVPTGTFGVFWIASGPDGNLWFTEATGNKIGRITTAGVITEFPVPTPASEPLWIASGPDGNLWFTEGVGGNKIGRITTAGVITEFPITTTPRSVPYGVTSGPDGNLWFTELDGNKIGRVNLAGAPDLTAVKTDNVSGVTTLGNSWTWNIHIANGGNGPANFANGAAILTDTLPSTNINYGSVSTANPTGITGTISCTITSNTLTCTASGPVSIAAAGSIDVSFQATPTAIGTFANPTAGPPHTTADVVYGQLGSFNTNTSNNGGVSANSLNLPSTVALDSSGSLYVADRNNRVLYYPAGSTMATRVYGQGGSFTTNTDNNGGVSAQSLSVPLGVALDSSGNLYVADNQNNRVLYYPAGSATATRVYGQGGSFTSNTDNNGGISADSLSTNYSVALDSSGNLYLSDYGNNRVLYYPAGSTTATRVYGQGGSFTTNTANKGGVSASSLFLPTVVALDSSGNLYVVDEANNRVLYYPAGSTTATRVFGQGGSFTTNTDNNGGISADSLSAPWGVALDSGGSLYVVDFNNNRMLKYDGNACAVDPGNVVVESNENNNSCSDTVNAVQATVQVTVSTNINGPTISVDGGTAFSGSQMFTWNIGSSHSLNTSTSQAAGVGKQYVWQTWSDTGAISHSVTAAANTTSYTANFKTQYMLTTAVSPAAAGAIFPASGFEDAGSAVPVIAMANPGYAFIGFTGGLSGTTTPQTLIVNAPKTVTANFMTPAQAIQNLINTINSMGLPGGVVNSLSATLKNIDPSNTNAACNKLNAFINKVAVSLKNNDLTQAQANQLLDLAHAIKASLGC